VDQASLLTLHRVVSPGSVRIRVCGEVDAYTAPALRAALVQELPGDVDPMVLEFRELTFMDGSGIKVLEWATVAFSPRRVELCDAPPIVRQLASITGLDRRLRFVVSDGAPRQAGHSGRIQKSLSHLDSTRHAG
jgi:anti-anti-sigma factor